MKLTILKPCWRPRRASSSLLVVSLYDQQEAFLRSAKITAEKPSKKGVTGTVRVTLTDGKTTHDASVQRVNEHQAVGQNSNGQTELNLYDKYIYNVAAWKLARMLGVEDMVPPSVERNYQGVGAAFTWWIDDVLMDEEDRVAKKVTPPDSDTWGKEIQVMRVYDQLLYNVDSNATNLLIDKQWNVWLIDHTRSFRPQKVAHGSEGAGHVAIVICWPKCISL